MEQASTRETPTSRGRHARHKRAKAFYQSGTGAARWVAAAEIFLSAVEKAAWDLRHSYERLGETVLGTWDLTKEAAVNLEQERRDRQEELVRLLKISAVVGKVIFSYRLFGIQSAFMSERRAAQSLARLHQKNGRRLARMCEDLQAGVAKIGQMLSSRSDLLPKELTGELTHLLDACKPLPAETVHTILAAAWGERFTGVTVDDAPLGSGTVGQVHRAVLPGERIVAVKVLRPGIERLLRGDLRNLRRVAMALRPYMPGLDLGPLLDEIELQLLREVDIEAERAALCRMQALTGAMKWAVVPAPVDDWSCAGVLVTELMAGERIDRALASRDHERQSDILFTLAENYALQILQWGFFQPDTHPGNFLVDETDRIVLLDFGSVKEIPQAFRFGLLNVVRHYLANNNQGIAESLAAMGFQTQSGDLLPMVAMGRRLIDAAITHGDWDAQKILAMADEGIDALTADPVTAIPPEIIMVGRALGTLGGMYFTYRPKIDLGSILLPILAEAMSETEINS